LGGGKFIDGQDLDPETIGIAIYTCVLVVITIKLSIETSSWTWLNVVSYLGTLLIWPLFVFIYGSVYFIFRFPYPLIRETYGILERYRIFFSLQFWLVLLAVALLCCLRDIFWKMWVRTQSRKLYYEIQQHKQKTREEIMQHFPFEEGLPIKMKKKFNPIELQEIRKIFAAAVAKVDYRGFAFSQTENQQDIMKSYYNGK